MARKYNLDVVAFTVTCQGEDINASAEGAGAPAPSMPSR